jgi:threonine dehydratase
MSLIVPFVVPSVCFKGARVGVIVSGGNVDLARYADLLATR